MAGAVGLAVLVLGASSAPAGAATMASGKTAYLDLRGSALAFGAGYEWPHGSRRVRMLQRELRRLGVSPGPFDGLFGPRTEAAVRAFQHEQGLAPDGIVGTNTASALDAAAGPRLHGGAGSSSRKGSRHHGSAKESRRVTTHGNSPPPSTRGQSVRADAPAQPGLGWLLAPLAAFALLTAIALGLLVSRRAEQTRSMVPGLSNLVVAGHAPEIGDFWGTLQDLSVRSSLWRGERRMRFLVSDPEHPQEFWVDMAHVSLVTIDARLPQASKN